MPVSLVDLFRRPLRADPGRQAVSVPGRAPLSYAELERASRAVASRLLEAGVQRGDRVALVVPKSVEAVVSVWGVLRSGAAYVPVDPSSPPAHAATLAADCSVAAVIGSGRLDRLVAAVGKAVPEARLIPVHGEDGDAWLHREDVPPLDGAPSPNPRDLAYILYTSGSTGTPKGVMVSHGAALCFIEWAAWRFELGPGDVVAGHAPLHFDLSTFDLFSTALAGGHLVVLDEETVRFPMACADVLESEGVTVLYAVPGALRRMMRHGRLASRELPSLRTVLFAGEIYPADELRELREALPGRRLFNLFGPTETNVCTYWEVPASGSWEGPDVPIGVDVDGCETVVVDPDGRPVPPGTRGELLVRGGTLMEGYWGRPERDADCFVPDVLHPHLSDRLYRTGDLVTRREDGVLMFHGRADHQVKVRGHRIELGQVEAALHRIDEISDAAVVAVSDTGPDGLADTRLVAFVVTRSRAGDGEPESELRRSLRDRIPPYMVPGEFRSLPSLPRTSNGKVDRQELTRMALP